MLACTSAEFAAKGAPLLTSPPHGRALPPGVALCRLHSDGASLDGLEIMLKGGQMGRETLFEELLSGNA